MSDKYQSAEKLQLMQAIKEFARVSNAPTGEWLRFSAEVCLEPTGEVTMAAESLDPITASGESPARREATYLERRMAQALNTVKAWGDSDVSTPFPEDVRTDIDALLATYEIRRVN